MHRQLIAALAGVLLSIGPVAPAWAQQTTATFAGIVTDKDGGVLPGVDVELTNQGTGAVTRQVTTGTGEFLFTYVPVGSYSLKIVLSGFKTYASLGIPLGAAQNVRRTYVLEVGGLEESITVTGEAPLVNAASPEQRRNLETIEVTNLPLANRNISNILNLATGMTKQDASEGTNGVRFRLNGLGGSSLRVIANGTDANGNAGSPSLSQYQGFNKIDVMSSEAVAEAQVVKGVVPAEYGQAMAGTMSLITKSGTNRWHGSLFERYEGSVLSSKDFFLASKPESRWNQFGGSVGGPIVKNRAFFFFASEGYRQKTAKPVTANVPTELLRQTMLTALPFPETKLLLDFYPLPTQATAPGALTGAWLGPAPKTAEDDHFDGRVDVQALTGNLSATFTTGHPSLVFPSSTSGSLPTDPRSYTSLTKRLSTSYVLARGRYTSETRVGYNYNSVSRTDILFNASAPRGAHLPIISFPGITSPAGEQQNRGDAPSLSFEQQVAAVLGQHTFKFGGIFSRPAGGRPDTDNTITSYSSLADLVANNPSQVSSTLGTNNFVWRVKNFGLFVQDDWRANNKLVVNLGVRYDYFGHYVATPVDPAKPAGLFNLDGLLDEQFHFGPLRDPNNAVDSNPVNFDPRLGFAYTVDDRGNTVFRGGFGVMHQPIDPQIYENQTGNVSTVPFRTTFSRAQAQALGLRWPVYYEDVFKVFQSSTTGAPQVAGIFDPQMKAPYALNFSVSVQRVLPKSMMVETAYIGTRGRHFSMARNYNPVDRVTGLRPNPQMGENVYWDDSQNTSYNSWQTTLTKKFSHHLLFNANYTLSRAMATAGGDISPGFIGDATNNVQDFFNLAAEFGPASGDITHQFVGNWVYEIPWSGGRLRPVLGGWQVAGVFRAATGVPLDITEPSTIAGSRPDVTDLGSAINTSCCSAGNLQYLNPSAFVRVPISTVSSATVRAGNLGNHALRGPARTTLDLAASKMLFGHLDLRVDALNALNHVNFTTVQGSILAANFGQVTATDSARIVQLQLRYSF